MIGLPYANRVKRSSRFEHIVATPLETSNGGGFAILNVTNLNQMSVDYVLKHGVVEGGEKTNVNETVYALEFVESKLYVAATDGILRVYQLFYDGGGDGGDDGDDDDVE